MIATTKAAFELALSKAKSGNRIVYHTGSLLYDRQLGPTFQTVNGVACAAWEAHEAGQCILFQKSVAPCVHVYMAEKR